MADRTIGELPSATQVNPGDLFVLEQSSSAKKLTGQMLENWLLSFANGHGGIQNIEKTGTSGIVDTYTITYADESTSTFTVTNGAKGDTGPSERLWIKYASRQPIQDSDMSDSPDEWVGVCAATGASAPTAYTAYTWYNWAGPIGETGLSIDHISRTSGSGLPGTIDTYSVVLSDGSSAGTFTVYNGADGAGFVRSVNNVFPGQNGNIVLAAEDVGAVGASQFVVENITNVPAELLAGETVAFEVSVQTSIDYVYSPIAVSGITPSSDLEGWVAVAGFSVDRANGTVSVTLTSLSGDDIEGAVDISVLELRTRTGLI